MPQPPALRSVERHGVKITQTQLQSKWYTPVDARVKIAEQADPALIRREGASYHVVAVEFVQMGDRWVYHCLVEYPAGSGIVKPGSDFIDLKDSAGVAKAETSAIGRALGLHGIAIDESIASAEEMHSVTGVTAAETTADAAGSDHEHMPAAATPATSPTTRPDTATASVKQQMAETDQKQASNQMQQNLLNALREAHLETTGNVRAFLTGQLGEERAGAVNLGDLRMCKSDLTIGELRTLTNALTRQPALAQA